MPGDLPDWTAAGYPQVLLLTQPIAAAGGTQDVALPNSGIHALGLAYSGTWSVDLVITGKTTGIQYGRYDFLQPNSWVVCLVWQALDPVVTLQWIIQGTATGTAYVVGILDAQIVALASQQGGFGANSSIPQIELWSATAGNSATRLLGKTTAANSLPVVLASDSSATDVSDRAARLLGHVSLDSGGTLIGQQLMAASFPVVLASDHSPVLVTQRNPTFLTAFSAVSRGIGSYIFDTFGEAHSYQGKGLIAWLAVTAGTGNATLDISEIDPNFLNVTAPVVTSAAVTNGGLIRLKIYPGITPIANLSVSDVLGESPRFHLVIAGGPVTATVTYLWLA